MKTSTITGAESLNKSTLDYARLQMENSLKQKQADQPQKNTHTTVQPEDGKGTKIDVTA